ncbi:hypothetical protein EB796_010949 [Bugula neritina]|uniref:Uncharacterized protein n=1 Tax=Bugula neritina TaxID=10212 RepID=A0A7J7JWD2_BUGNE|nr:hypothetical protein EB796_010949 [Bugula neritina]
MDLEGEKLDEDIHQIQLVLQSSHQQGDSHQLVEEDSDEDVELHACSGQGSSGQGHNDPFFTVSTLELSTTYLHRGEGDVEKSTTNDVEDSSKEELGDTLETALKLNLAYQELLRIHLGNLKELLDKNIQNQVTFVQ